jgi:hypothetical protein
MKKELWIPYSENGKIVYEIAPLLTGQAYHKIQLF